MTLTTKPKSCSSKQKLNKDEDTGARGHGDRGSDSGEERPPADSGGGGGDGGAGGNHNNGGKDHAHEKERGQKGFNGDGGDDPNEPS